MSDRFPFPAARPEIAEPTAPVPESAATGDARPRLPVPARPEPVPLPHDPAPAAPAADLAADEPRPLGVAFAATGNADVDAVVERLGDADDLPVQAHLEVYEDVHRGLRDALAALDENRG